MEVLERIWNLLPFAIALVAITWLYARARKNVSERRTNAPPRLDPESSYTVVISDTQIAVQRPDKTVEQAQLDQLERILIRTNALGPWFPDFWWEFYTCDGLACSFPEGATGQAAAMDLAGRLPDFDFANFRAPRITVLPAD